MAKAKRPFLSGYKTYDPTVYGFGHARQWKAAFAATMNLDEARAAVGDDSPEGILGVVRGAVWAVVLSAYRKASLACHPDRCASHGLSVDVATERFKKVCGAYTILKERYGM